MDALKLKPNEQTSAESLLKLAHTIDQFEQYTRPHASQIAQLAELIAIRVGLSGADLNAIKVAALLHDIGELAMDAPGVRSTGLLDFKNRLELWRHPVIGEQQLAKRGLSRQIQFLVRWHHEWWNGSGYPDMLSGEAIPIGARILRLADSFDALTAWRPYREAFTAEQAYEMIAASAGIEFDPFLVKIFFEIVAEARQAELESVASAVPVPEPELPELQLPEPQPELQPEFQPELQPVHMPIEAAPIEESPVGSLPVEPAVEPAVELAIEPEPAAESLLYEVKIANETEKADEVKIADEADETEKAETDEVEKRREPEQDVEIKPEQ